MRNLVLIIFFALLSMANSYGEVRSVPQLDLESYLGKWYEIASIPQFFERKCVANTTAEYSLDEEERIKVLNSCDTKKKRMSAEGRARPAGPDSNSKLEVTFVKFMGWVFLFSGDYWVLDVDQDYSYAVVGNENADYAWILSREPFLSVEKLESAASTLKENGYDLCDLMMTVQDGGFGQEQKLCEVVDGEGATH